MRYFCAISSTNFWSLLFIYAFSIYVKKWVVCHKVCFNRMFGDKKKLSLDLLLGGWVWLPVKDRVLNEIIGYLYPRAILIHLPYCALHKRWIKVATIYVSNAQCDVCTVFLMFSLQPNKLRHILKFMSWYIIQHISVPACSVGRKTWFSRKPAIKTAILVQTLWIVSTSCSSSAGGGKPEGV